MAKISRKKFLLAGAVLVAAIAGFSFLSKKSTSAPGGAGGPAGAQQAMPVKAVIVEKKPLRLWTSFPGHMEAVDYVELRPQVSGRIDQIKFRDGQNVKKGDLLFIIDPRPYQASVEEAEAAVKGAQNRQELALTELNRAAGLIKADAISQRIYDERQNRAEVEKNALEAAQASLARAKVDLDHAYMKAPISGRISRAEITEGNLVEAGPNAPVLTTIVSSEGIYADFEVDERTYLQNVRPKNAEDGEAEIPVKLLLNNNGETEYEGHIQSFDNRIDASSGTIRARAYFKNEDGTLLPGMFVNIQMGSAAAEGAILLTEQAIGTDQDRKFVYIVDDNGKVAYRQVHLGASMDGQRVVTAGLEPGEKVIIEGLMKLRPDMVVSPQIENGDAQNATPLLPDPAQGAADTPG